MKLIVLMFGFVVSLIITFCLWCCIRVGGLSDKRLKEAEEMEWLHNREKDSF